MSIHRPNPLDPVGGQETPRDVYLNRRKWLARAGLLSAGGLLAAGGYGLWRGTDRQVLEAGRSAGAGDAAAKDSAGQGGAATGSGRFYPAPRDARFAYDRPETNRVTAARHTNFYEFSTLKSSWRFVDPFQPHPWTLSIDGLCRQPVQLDMDEFHRRYGADLVERLYRFRCVETWAMAIPWIGVPLARLLQDADPLPAATHVRFVSFHRPDEAPNITARPEFPWPYSEGLTLPEALCELTLLATGMYGEPLLKQHGAPIRLVVPWKYGYKSIKSIERIELVAGQPTTFWNTANAEAYPFESNVEPEVPRPWPQHYEKMLGTGEQRRTVRYNGYGEFVAGLYS